MWDIIIETIKSVFSLEKLSGTTVGTIIAGAYLISTFLIQITMGVILGLLVSILLSSIDFAIFAIQKIIKCHIPKNV